MIHCKSQIHYLNKLAVTNKAGTFLLLKVLTSKDWDETTDKLKAPFGMFIEEQMKALDIFKSYFELMRFKHKNGTQFKIILFQVGQ